MHSYRNRFPKVIASSNKVRNDKWNKIIYQLLIFANLLGDTADGMYFIEGGQVSIRLEQETGGEVEISVLGKGAYFGELALVTHRPRAASAYAMENIKVACKWTIYQGFIIFL